ncbi:MAG TPA: insulinase family protein [Spirochaetales bacterium]|nr:insulinase family protein [Spirochaetales bacterium]
MSFTLIEQRNVPEIDSIVRLYKHDGTGARLLSIINKDENKSFGISFRTPPTSSNGVAHIMEHSTLCGSRKYPVKEPFVELMKSSLNTFLNALTFPDKTVYPVASTNLKDFYNLIDVYLDAVFYPTLSEDIFRQEGWHYEVEPDGSLSRKGVVYNEMKGAYSDPDEMHADWCRRSLFPDTTYGFDSGGDPEVIPQLDYDTFVAFHKKYYHPSNSFIFFYGDDDPDTRLSMMDAWLAPFSRADVDSMPGLQAPFTAPISMDKACDGNDDKGFVAVNWGLAEHGDLEYSIALTILTYILVGTPASPLRKALIDSGYGEDLAGFGYEESMRQTAWSIGLKGVAPENMDKVESLILDTLTQLAKDGIDPDTIEASINTVEFALREKNTGNFPRGLAVMFEALGEWLYDKNPIDALEFEAPIRNLRATLAKGERFFESMIDSLFLKNQFRSTVRLLPSADEGRRREAKEKAELAAIRAQLSDAEIEALKAQVEALNRRQETPDSPEALATIPSLDLADIPKEVPKLPSEAFSIPTGAGQASEKSAVCMGLFHDLPTSSILYFDIAFPFTSIEPRLLPYVSILGRAILETGTDKFDYITIMQEIGKHTGGIGASVHTGTVWDSKKASASFIVRSKAMAEKTEKLFEILTEVLLHAKLDNKDRLRQIVLEEKAQAEASAIPEGHRLVITRMRSHFSEADAMAERLRGCEQLFFLRGLAERIDTDWSGVLADLEAVRNAVLNYSNAIYNVTLDRANFEAVRPQLEGFVQGLVQAQTQVTGRAQVTGRVQAQGQAPNSAAPDANAVIAPSAVPEVLLAPTQVNFVGRAYPIGLAGAPANGAFRVVKKYLDTVYLWEKIRVQGGAYGCPSVYDLNTGVFAFASYRDPNLGRTLEVYDAASDFLEMVEISEDELRKCIIGTIGDVDIYMLPDAKGFASLVNYLVHYTDEKRQEHRDELLAASKSDFRSLARALRVARDSAVTTLLTSQTGAQTLPAALHEHAQEIQLL